MRALPAWRPCWSRESCFIVPGSTDGRAGCGAGRVDGFDGAGRVEGCDGAGRVVSTGFHLPLSFVSQAPGFPGRGRYTLPSGPA